MSEWMKSKSSGRAPKPYESSSAPRWSTQSNCSLQTDKKEDAAEKYRKKLKNGLWWALNDFYPKASVSHTHKATTEIMKMVEKYCRFKKRSTKAKENLVGFSKPSVPVKAPSFVKPLKIAKATSVAKPFNDSKSSNVEKTISAAKSSRTKESKSGSISAKKDMAKKPDKTVAVLEKELKRLADSDGFMMSYPTRFKRVPKAVQRFSDAIYETNKPRRAVVRKRYDAIAMVDEATKNKCKVARSDAIHQVQQHQTMVQKSSTIVSQVNGAASTSGTHKSVVSSIKQTVVRNFNYKGTWITHLPMIPIKTEKQNKWF